MSRSFTDRLPQCCKLGNEYAFKLHCDRVTHDDDYFGAAVSLRDFLRGELNDEEPEGIRNSNDGPHALLIAYATKGTTVADLLAVGPLRSALIHGGMDYISVQTILDYDDYDEYKELHVLTTVWLLFQLGFQMGIGRRSWTYDQSLEALSLSSTLSNSIKSTTKEELRDSFDEALEKVELATGRTGFADEYYLRFRYHFNLLSGAKLGSARLREEPPELLHKSLSAAAMCHTFMIEYYGTYNTDMPGHPFGNHGRQGLP